MSSRGHNSDAPLPSPAAASANQRFVFPSAGSRQTTEQMNAQAQLQAQQAQTQAAAQAVAQSQFGGSTQQRASGANDVSAYHNKMDNTSPFRNNLSLVAEAAKRAQMAVLMRDMGDVAL